ncbi:GNAT family N-acetyltransferase [Brumimicrobium mesophilum]|uniref:GNAT family N-acetyltransferase n=1 Tax=Brumimicrobium mesophilum TaxID=392717 RepID=UPI000D140B4A|nr:GNAT family N-acetyltransferase [Brumimicrobium mesophilum]
MQFNFKKANPDDASSIWNILQQAIAQRKSDGSNQWQDGYPNEDSIRTDIKNNVGFVLTADNDIVGYCAILINDEPEYDNIDGEWLTNEDFVVYHRVAIAKEYLGKGLAKKMLNYIDQYALENEIYSVKADTNFDNGPMLALFEKLDYKYCGEVYFRGSPRRAYEKVL